jgi:hypothetical protein
MGCSCRMRREEYSPRPGPSHALERVSEDKLSSAKACL